MSSCCHTGCNSIQKRVICLNDNVFCRNHYLAFYNNYYYNKTVNINDDESCSNFRCGKHKNLLNGFCVKHLHNKLPKRCYYNNCLYIGECLGAWGKFYCKEHYKGNICNYIKCYQTQNIIEKYKAYWCEFHIETINNIRNNIDHRGSNREIYARLLELKVRKDKDNSHIYYYIKKKAENIGFNKNI